VRPAGYYVTVRVDGVVIGSFVEHLTDDAETRERVSAGARRNRRQFERMATTAHMRYVLERWKAATPRGARAREPGRRNRLAGTRAGKSRDGPPRPDGDELDKPRARLGGAP
jgi:hypothetical protein